MKTINNQYATETGTTANGQTVTTLYKTHGKFENGQLFELSSPEQIKDFYFTANSNDTETTEVDILNEIVLNDWSRWNKELTPNNTVEVSEYIYYEMLSCLPPINMNGSYFEVGEAHHHDNTGKPIHRAFWVEGSKYFTGYPKA